MDSVLAPFASLTLVLWVAVLVITYSTPRGMLVTVAESHQECGDGPRATVLTLAANGVLAANGRIVSVERLRNMLAEKFKHQAEQVVYINADLGRSFDEVIDVTENAKIHSDHVALVTPIVAKNGCLSLPMSAFRDLNEMQPKYELKPVPLWPWRE